MAKLLGSGQTALTNGIWACYKDESITPEEVMRALARHRRGDWGDTCPEDAAVNTECLNTGEGRIISVFTSLKGEKF
jgi:hypothetical protein